MRERLGQVEILDVERIHIQGDQGFDAKRVVLEKPADVAHPFQVTSHQPSPGSEGGEDKSHCGLGRIKEVGPLEDATGLR